MGYHTNLYLFFFLPAVLVTYQLVPQKMRWKVLLGYSYLFFWLFSKKLVLYLIGTTLLIHYGGIWIAWLKMRCQKETEGGTKEEKAEIKNRYRKEERAVLAGCILFLLAILAYLKYYNFFVENVNALAGTLGKAAVLPIKHLLMPIGISFYTLQAIGYMADVYWEKIPAERHLGKLALFLGFFPQIMEGPICSFQDTAEALWKGEPLRGENLSRGCVRILWGLFKKIIVADRLYVFVSTVFDHYESYSGVAVAAAAVAYTIQLYMEFSGCMDIVIGSGRMFGVCLPENFRQPFASKNAGEFWRRWHITLGVWFKTYVFYPMSVSCLVKKWNKYGRKHMGKCITKVGTSALALLPVWLGNGLWHGARWSYIFYGIYYFVILLFGVMAEPVRKKVLELGHLDENALYWRIPQILKTWLIIFVGELFFRAEGLRQGMEMFSSMFRGFDVRNLWDGTLLRMGMGQADFAAVFAGCVIVGVVGALRERNIDVEERIFGMRLPLRWMLYYGLILAVVIFGAYGTGYQAVDLIYAGF